jgi:predicted MFS family arabinose efflux permease
MDLPNPFRLLWLGQTLSRIGILSPAFLVLYLKGVGITGAGTTSAVVTLFGAGVVVSGLVGGAVADTFGARRTIIATQPMAMATALAFTLTTDVAAVCALALVAGFLSAVDRPAGAGLIAEILPADQFSRGYSLYLVGFNVGIALSAVLAGFLLAWHPLALFYAWALAALVYTAVVWPLPRDHAAHGARQHTGPMLRSLVHSTAEPFRSPVLVLFLGMTFLVACIYLQVNSTLPLDMRGWGLSTQEIGVALSVNAVLPIVLLPLVPRLVGQRGEETPLAAAAALVGLGFGLNALADGFAVFTAGIVIWTLGEVLWAPMSATFLAKRAPEGRTASYQGAFFFAWNMAFVVGGPAGIAAADVFGYRVLWLATLVLGLCAAAGLKLMPAVPGFHLESEPRDGEVEGDPRTKDV